MKPPLKIILMLVLLVARASAFSLLGPYADWMQTTNGYREFLNFDYTGYPSDIGGPMDLGEE